MNQQRRIRICDRTLNTADQSHLLSFRDKTELCRIISCLDVSVIEMNPIIHQKADSLFIKTISSVIQNAVISVPVSLDPESISVSWESLRNASKKRLQLSVPVSSVQMEYLYHMKPEKMISSVTGILKACRGLTDDVELIAEDATRSDAAFLREMIREAAKAGAGTVTVCDTAGALMPDETASFISSLIADLPELSGITLGYACSNDLNLADACAMAAVCAGAGEIKGTVCRSNSVSISNIARLIQIKGAAHGLLCGVRLEQIRKLSTQVEKICRTDSRLTVSSSADQFAADESILSLDAHDPMDKVFAAAEKLGYELSPEDREKVWQCFCRIAEKKDLITIRELEAIIAAEAMQVEPVYHNVRYVINTGNNISAMSHMKLMKHEKELEGVSTGDGAIDAAFKSIEQATGRHFELDEFQIQAVSKGREAMGETIVKLRSEGKLYSGRGISTDIVGAGIMAYINALNKIVWEEEET